MGWVGWRAAWWEALYGDGVGRRAGFYRRQAPAAHFRTSVHASPLFARAVLELADRAGLRTVVDVGAGRGELLVELRRLDPDLDLIGVEVADRPPCLPDGAGWAGDLPERIDGLVVANEWLDDVPCEIAQVGDDGAARLLLVDPETGAETLGEPLSRADAAWCERWWPPGEPGSRVEIGRTRDAAWAEVVRRMGRGLAVAVDYGHTKVDRPSFGSVRSYLDGREVEVRLDGSRDVTAHVAVDSLADAVGAMLARQGEALASLGVSGRRPPLELAGTDPAGYLRALGEATEAAELTGRGGLGDFWWVVRATGGCPAPW